MTMFVNRYLVRGVGNDGLVHNRYVDHILLLKPEEYLLKKEVHGGVKEVRFIDTWRNVPVSNAELYAE